MASLWLVTQNCAFAQTVQAQEYELLLLDSSTNESCAYGINSYGWTCGYKFVDGKATPCLWDPSKVNKNLPALPGSVYSEGVAYAINDSFALAGVFSDKSPKFGYYINKLGDGIVWTTNDKLVFEPNAFTQKESIIRDINNNGDIVGIENINGGGGAHGFIRNIFTGRDAYYSYFKHLFSVNEYGSAVGTWLSCSPPYALFANTNTFFAYGLGFEKDYAGTGVNSFNEMVGVGEHNINSGYYGSFEGFYIDVGDRQPWEQILVEFGRSTACYGINDSSQIVGVTNGHACMWTKNPSNLVSYIKNPGWMIISSNLFSLVDLNRYASNANVVLEKAYCINDKGQIAGQCLNRDTGVRSAFMLTPAKGVPVALNRDTNELVLNWTATAGHLYAFRTSTNLSDWKSSPDIYDPAGNTNGRVTISPDQEKMFFRVLDLTP